MATKLFENISSVQNIPAATSDTPRDRYKPISLYLVGAGTGEWKVTVSYSPINSSVYKKLGPVFTLSVSNTNPFQLFSWDYDCDSFVAWVSEIKGNATATLWMTQGNARNLDYLLMTEPSARLKADPTDIPNCSLEYTPDGWVGNMGVFSTYGALLANPTNALVPGKVWAIVASASSFAKYNYMSAGWVLESSVGATGASNLPGSPSAPFPDAAARDAAYPSPTIGTRVKMINPAVGNPVVGGVLDLTNASWLEYIGNGKWAPPMGEDIASRYANPIASLTPGNLTLAELYGSTGNASPVIPDYMLPNGIAWQMESSIACAKTVTGSPKFGIGICATMPPTPFDGSFMQLFFSNSITGGQGFRGPNLGTTSYGYRVGDSMPFQFPTNYHTFYAPSAPPFVSGAMRVFAAVQSHDVADTFRMWSYRFVSRGLMGGK
jgi:hypothetical protein